MDGPAAVETELTRKQRAKLARRLRDQALSNRIAVWLIGPLATLLAVIVLVFFVLFDTSTVSGPSMMPTLRDHDYVLLTKGLRDPHRGDIVILNVKTSTGAEEWVKRIVGLPGDTVDVNGDVITINGAPEQFPHAILTQGATVPVEHLIVPAGRIFVAGDNRVVSEDSRYVGTFSLAAVKGRVVFIYAPWMRIGAVSAPAR